MSWFSTANRFSDPVGAKRIALYIDLLSRFKPGHLVDLGAGHGKFSQIAAHLGWRVTAVDVRDERFPEDAGITWVVSDVRDFDRYDDVDLVVCLGLWYHLTAEDQRALARRIYPRPLILDTHVALREVPANSLRFPVSPHLVRQGDDDGRLLDESKLQKNPTASWGNTESFWPTLRSLENQLYDAGYELFEQIAPPYLPDRGFFVARNLLRPAAPGGLDALVTTFGPRLSDPMAAGDATPPATLQPAVADWAPIEPTGPPPAQTTPQHVPAGVAARQLGRAVVRGARRRVRDVRARRSG